jgi:putative transposase
VGVRGWVCAAGPRSGRTALNHSKVCLCYPLREADEISGLGSQFTARAFIGRLEEAGIAVSMDGRGRALDNVFVERLWRSLKYEEVYLKAYRSVRELAKGLEEWFAFYNHERLHQSLAYRTPAEVYHGARPVRP